MSEKSPIMVTTYDNPFSPFTQFDEWYQFDISKGYDTLGVLDRMTQNSINLSEEDQDRISETSMIDLVKLLPETYKAVIREDYL